MKIMDARILTAGVLFVLAVVSGVWVSRSGRPLNTAVFTAHKLIAVATVVLLIIVMRAHGNAAPIPAVVVARVLTGFFFLCLFATGVMLSFDKPADQIIRIIHAALPLLAAVVAFAGVYLMR